MEYNTHQKKMTGENPATALNELYVKKEFCPAYISKHSSNCKKRIIFLMISKREVWHYLAVKTKTIYITKRNSFKT